MHLELILLIKYPVMTNVLNYWKGRTLKKGEENFILKDIITNMQRCINKSNSETRDKNVIITGVPEEAIATDNGRVNNDTDKIKWLLQLTKNNYFTENAYDNFDIRRLGKEKVGFNRVIKIILPSVQNRDEKGEYVKAM